MKWLIFGFAAMCLAGLAASCNDATIPSTEQSDSKSELKSDFPKQINALEASSNPYAGQYSIWDQEIYAVLDEAEKESRLGKLTQHAEELKDDDRIQNFDCYVDDGGNLVPKLLCAQIREEFFRTGSREARVSPFSSFHHILVPVPMTDEEYNDFNRAAAKVAARYLPPIPRWIYEETPIGGAIFYPNGDVMCFGEPQSLKSPETHTVSHDGDGHSGFNLFLFDSSGHLKAKGKGDTALELFVQNGGWSASDESTPVNIESTRDGYYILRHKESGEIVKVLDYDGSILPYKKEPPLRDLHNFFKVQPHTIKEYYEAQQEVGV